jgi:asparagine synthase (glutamine-hydrolysing)
MLSDVPVGAFLSGGVDSSTVVALMQSLSGTPIRTFSIGFKEPEFNEAPFAAAVARHLGTQHTELYVTAAQAQSVVRKLPRIYDEPFADASQVPTYLVSQLAGQSVTVALSGDGGDELFAGYPRYDLTAKAWSVVKRLPYGIRAAASRLLEVPTAAVWDNVLRRSSPLLPGIWRARHPAAQIERIANVLRQKSFDLLYRSMVSHWDEPEKIAPCDSEPLTALTDPERRIALTDPILRVMYADLLSYLPDDILTKVDRASMAVGLEVRVPLLDHRVVEFAWRLPMHLRARQGSSKWLLRQVLSKHVPLELFSRPKMGFGMPVGEWIRGPLRDWAEDLLAPKGIEEEGFFTPEVVRQTWREHLGHERNHHSRLWIILMFQAWYRQLRTCGLDGCLSENRIETAVNRVPQPAAISTRTHGLTDDLLPNVENAAF